MREKMLDKYRPTIFCFTHAGGTANFFDVIEGDFKSADLVKLEYAGHGHRHRESFCNSFDELADDMLKQMKNHLPEEYCLFGYSMGSIVAVEVLRKIIESKLSLPSHIFLAAHEAYTQSELLGYAPMELDEWVKKTTIEFGDVPDALNNNKVFWKTYLPVYRADYTLIGKYDFEKLVFHTDVPATIFLSETDTPLNRMKQWERYFAHCEYFCFEGNHFFIRDHHKEMADVIEGRIVK